MFPLDACIPSRVDVPLCIFAGIPFLMVRLSPMPWARDGCVTVFNVEPARITHVVICELFDKIDRKPSTDTELRIIAYVEFLQILGHEN